MDWLTDDTWIVSDTHWGHNNIIRYCDRPLNHDELMARLWNELVGDGDHVLHLGDVVWRHVEMPVLRGNIHLIRGNHDTSGVLRILRGLGWDVLSDPVVMHGPVAFSHSPLTSGDWETNVHGHIHNHSSWRGSLPGRDYVNVSVEVMHYRPVRLGEILTGAAGARSYERFF